MTKQEVIALLQKKVSQHVEEIDLRQTSIELRNLKEKKHIKVGIKDRIINIMKVGGILLLNLDDSKAQYDELSDPEFGTLFGGISSYQSAWHPEVMFQKENWYLFTTGKTYKSLSDKAPTDKASMDKSSNDKGALEKPPTVPYVVPYPYLPLSL